MYTKRRREQESLGMMSCTWSDVLPFAAMVMVQFTDIGAATISKAAMSKGLSSNILVVYATALAAVLLFPCFILQKKISLTFSLLGGSFLLSLFGSTSLLFTYNGINYSSPTVSAATANLIPIYTFILAIIFRMEKLDLRRSICQAKVLGTIVSVSGAFVVILYKGSIIFSPSNSPDQNLMMISQQSKWVFGGLMLAMGSFLKASWTVLQTSFVKNCPSMITIVFFYNFFVAIQSAFFSLFVESNPNAWVPRPDIEMVSIAFSAVFGNLFHIGVETWCLHQKGPVYVTMFRPLGVAIAAVMVVIFLGDALHLGSVIGSIIIAVGFYAMMWAQIKESIITLMEHEVQSLAPSSTLKTPLLQCRTSVHIIGVIDSASTIQD